MGLVLQVDGDDGVIVLVVVGEPSQSVQPVLLAEVCVIPQCVVMTCGIGCSAVNVHHDLDTVLAAPLDYLIPDVEAVHGSTALNALNGQLRIFVLIELDDRVGLACLPLEKYLR